MRRKLTPTLKSKLPFRYLFLRIARLNGYLTYVPQYNDQLDVADQKYPNILHATLTILQNSDITFDDCTLDLPHFLFQFRILSTTC